jgi:hypothetical protein
MIEPTVGRVVWYSHNHEPSPYPQLGNQPFAAHVAFVHSERLVNLLVIAHTGQVFARESVILLQEGDTAPASAPYAEWMPYQKGQAAKTEALQAANKPESVAAAKPTEQAVSGVATTAAAATATEGQAGSAGVGAAPQATT